MPHILIFDIGKTNKKCLVFDEDYQIVIEKSTVLPETTDEDGFPCEDLHILVQWILNSYREILEDDSLDIKAINASAYGASFVHLNDNFEPITPLYNYLKPFPEYLKEQFFNKYGSDGKIALETASPILGNLNSGLQLYFLKHHKPLIFNQIKYSLHLPQFIASLLSHQYVSELTSIGCHTMLWDFQKNSYHEWVITEDIDKLFPPLFSFSHPSKKPNLNATIGLHDSSAALIPYLATFKEPFVLISTGTWCISLNPFNDEPLTPQELRQDCLCYLTHQGQPVKAARFFGGNEHEKAVNSISVEYGVSPQFYKNTPRTSDDSQFMDTQNALDEYVEFMKRLVEKQVTSTRLAIGNSGVQQIFVDGGFSKNEIFMNLLAKAFSGLEVYAAEVAQATALGAAVVLHEGWNTKPLPNDLIKCKRYN